MRNAWQLVQAVKTKNVEDADPRERISHASVVDHVKPHHREIHAGGAKTCQRQSSAKSRCKCIELTYSSSSSHMPLCASLGRFRAPPCSSWHARVKPTRSLCSLERHKCRLSDRSDMEPSWRLWQKLRMQSARAMRSGADLEARLIQRPSSGQFRQLETPTESSQQKIATAAREAAR